MTQKATKKITVWRVKPLIRQAVVPVLGQNETFLKCAIVADTEMAGKTNTSRESSRQVAAGHPLAWHLGLGTGNNHM